MLTDTISSLKEAVFISRLPEHMADTGHTVDTGVSYTERMLMSLLPPDIKLHPHIIGLNQKFSLHIVFKILVMSGHLFHLQSR